MILGVHVSTSGGLDKACQRASDMGANGIQIFTGSPMMWRVTPWDRYQNSAREFSEARKKYGIDFVVVHATYLVNLASEKEDLLMKSRNVLVNDMKINSVLGLGGLVVHLGSHMGRGYGAVREQLISEITKILEASPDNAKFLIENSAGQKGKIGSELEEIRDLVDGVGSDRVGWCLDTCHAFCSGYSLSRNSKLQITNVKTNSNNKFQNPKQSQSSLFETNDETNSLDTSYTILHTKTNDDVNSQRILIDEIERLNLWDSLHCVHVNESRDKYGSGRDRHANLGEGEIGDQALGEFLHHPKVKILPLIMEVPGFDKKGPDRENVERLKVLVGA